MKALNIPKVNIINALSKYSRREAAKRLGVSFNTLKRHAVAHNIWEKLEQPRYDSITKHQINIALVTNSSLRQAAKSLGLNDCTFRRLAKKFNITITPSRKPAVPLLEILNGNHPSYNRNHLRYRILHAKVFKLECARCTNTTWQEAPIPLELDHIDGNCKNHHISNLRLLCPNCHALTSTYCGRNIKNRRERPANK